MIGSLAPKNGLGPENSNFFDVACVEETYNHRLHFTNGAVKLQIRAALQQALNEA